MSEGSQGDKSTERKKKMFLTKTQLIQVQDMYKNGMKTKEIALAVGSTPRQIAQHIRQYKQGKVKEWTWEEDEVLKANYLSGNVKEWSIVKFLPRKEAYMVRNRIRYLLRHNKMELSTPRNIGDDRIDSVNQKMKIIIIQNDTPNTPLPL